MKFRIANPRRKRKGSCARVGRKLARCRWKKKRSSRRRRKLSPAQIKFFGTKAQRAKLTNNKGNKMARRHRKSRRVKSTRRRSTRRRRNAYIVRRANPMLMVGNPRKRRRSRRSRRSNPRSYRRRSNPPMRMGSYISMDIFKDVFVGAAGFASARLVRDQVAKFYPVGVSATTEGILNIGVKVATAAIGGMLVAKINRRYARSFAIGSLTSAAWDIIAMITGKPMSLSEYVSPIATSRLSCGGNMAGVHALARGGRNLKGAFGPGFSKAF